jgi:NADPH:quinone reductase-like Zn-dependent oxidoreductase
MEFQLMKAIVRTRYGSPDVLRYTDVEKPVPKNNEVLIRVRAATVTAGDCEMRSFTVSPLFWIPLRIMFGVRRPRHPILGQEMAGEIVEVGSDVTGLNVGDRIFAPTTMRFGAHAEYICLPAKLAMAPLPVNMTFEEAATIPTGGLNALHFLRKASIRPGEHILINGAGGSIGTFGVQLAKYYGAEVTAVDSTEKLDMLRSIGADHVVDYTQEDISKSGRTYDVIFDVVGKSPFARSVRSLNEGGRYLLANPRLIPMLRGLWVSRRSTKRVMPGLASYKTEDLLFLKERIEAGDLTTVVDRTWPLEATPDAHRYVDTGQKKGNVVITV